MTENPNALSEYTTVSQTKASVAIGSKLVGTLLSLPPLDSKILFYVSYLNALTSEPFTTTIIKLGLLVGARNRTQVYDAVESLVKRGRLIKEDLGDGEISLLVASTYGIEIVGTPKTMARTYAGKAKAKAAKDDNKITIPPGDEESPVRMLKEEYDALYAKFGEANADFLIDELAAYLPLHPNKYKDHYRVVLNWDKMKRERGLIFAEKHPKHGTGYFPAGLVR
jgi:hypothetical protein